MQYGFGFGYRGVLCWLLLAASLVPLQVKAQALPSYVGGAAGGTLRAGAMNAAVDTWRTYAANSSGYVTMADKVRVGIGAANADMYAVRGLLFKDALAMGARAIPIIGTAALAWSIYDAIRCHPDGTGFACDAGVAAATSGQYRVCYTGGVGCAYGATPQAACLAYASPKGGTPYWNLSDQFSCKSYKTGSFVDNQPITQGSYPNPCADGRRYADSKCPGGSMDHLTPDQAAGSAAPTVAPDALPGGVTPDGIVKQAQGAGVDASPYVQPKTATGPSSVVQPSTSTQTVSPNGTVQQSTSTVTNNITYSGDTYNITNTTTTTNPDGSTTTKTDTPQKTDCELFPTVAGCVELGTPDSANLPTDTKTISFTPVSFGGSSGCPSPVSFSAFGHSYSISYDAMCDTLGTWVRGVVLLAGALLASYVFVQGLKS